MFEEENLPPPVTGLVAGKYELVRLIGRGGMGSVWEGRHSSLGTRVAIKFIEAEYAASNEARARFDNEARAAATIQSKHAIQIFDHGVTESGRPYIVMEMLVGEPLDRRIDRVGRMSLQETARILGQVCRALQRAHDSGIIHRDLKPENIFLVRSPDDDDEVAKVLDFGIAKMAPPPGQQGVSSSTKTGAVLGTPYYMSPEQARGLRNVDHRTDLWSLGVIAYKCTIGVLPFEGESVGDLLVKICTSPVPVPSHVVQGLPTTFDAWFMRALDREPDRRFSSASELSEGLAFAAGLSVRRGPTSSNPQYPDARYGPPPSIQHPSSGPAHQPMMMTPGPPNPMHGSASASQHGRMSAMPPTTPSPAATPQYMQGSQGSPGMTAAPFVSSTRGAGKSSRGVVVASILAALIGVSVGAIAIVKLSGGSAANGGSGTPSATASTTATATASTTASTAATSTAGTAVATASASASATPSATTAATGKGGFRPGTATATATASTTSTDKSTITTKPTAVPTTQPTKVPTKPTSDPGY